MAKKGVKFDNMNTLQKVVHVLGWMSFVSGILTPVFYWSGAFKPDKDSTIKGLANPCRSEVC